MSHGFLLVANGAAGSAEREQVELAGAALAAGGSARGSVEVVGTSSPEEMDAALDRLDGRALVVAGGDGSLHVAVHRLWLRGPEVLARTPIGLVPLGTGNDFARGLGIPTDPRDAAARCGSGCTRTLDLLETDDGNIVVNASHAGIGAEAARRSADLKRALGPASYPLGALLAGITEGAHDLAVEVDGRQVWAGPTLMVGIANAPYIGGGTALAPGAEPDDGLLDVVVVTAVEPTARAGFAVALRRSAHLDRDDVTAHRGREVRFAGEPLLHDLDGEVLDPGPLRYRVRPAAWTLLGG